MLRKDLGPLQVPLDQLKMMQLHDRILRESTGKDSDTATKGPNKVKLPNLTSKTKSIQSFESTKQNGKRSPNKTNNPLDVSMGAIGSLGSNNHYANVQS